MSRCSCSCKRNVIIWLRGFEFEDVKCHQSAHRHAASGGLTRVIPGCEVDSPLHLRGLERWQKTWRMPPAAFSHCGTDLYIPSMHSSLHLQCSLSVSTPAIKPSRFSSYHERPWVDQVHAWPDSFRLKLKAKLTTKNHLHNRHQVYCVLLQHEPGGSEAAE
jgi:hypothetical protein